MGINNNNKAVTNRRVCLRSFSRVTNTTLMYIYEHSVTISKIFERRIVHIFSLDVFVWEFQNFFCFSITLFISTFVILFSITYFTLLLLIVVVLYVCYSIFYSFLWFNFLLRFLYNTYIYTHRYWIGMLNTISVFWFQCSVQFSSLYYTFLPRFLFGSATVYVHMYFHIIFLFL